MALPTSIAKHIHITEREVAHTWPDGHADDAKWEDCGYVSLVEFLRLTYRPDLPATHAFAEELRSRIEGPSGGSLPSELAAAAKTIGQTGPKTPGIVLKGVSAANLWAAMTPGTVGCVAGSMGAFPSGHTLRRWDPGFAGGHQVLAVRIDDQDRVWWCDPLAPVTLTDGSKYQGQWVSKADFISFVKALNSTSFVAPIQATAEPTPPPAPVTYTQAQLDAAVASAKAAEAAKTTAAVAAETTRATNAERARIRAILGI